MDGPVKKIVSPEHLFVPFNLIYFTIFSFLLSWLLFSIKLWSHQCFKDTVLEEELDKLTVSSVYVYIRDFYLILFRASVCMAVL